MQALTHAASAQMRGWIPIREKLSSEVPFDISTERLLLVPRSGDDDFDPKDFERVLHDRVSALVEDFDA